MKKIICLALTIGITAFLGGKSMAFAIVDDSETPPKPSLNEIAVKNSNFGSCTQIGTSYCFKIDYVNVKNPKTGLSEKKLSSEHYVRLFKFSKQANVCINCDEYFDYFNAGSTKTLSIANSYTKGTEFSYMITNAQEIKYGYELSENFGVGSTKVEYKGYASHSNTFTETKEATIKSEYTISSTTSNEYSIPWTGFYRLETRALFDVYIIQEYSLTYDVTYSTYEEKYVESPLLYSSNSLEMILDYKGCNSTGVYKYIYSDSLRRYTIDRDKIPQSDLVYYMD